MAGSPRALTPPTSRRPKHCWRSWRDKRRCPPHRSDRTPNPVTPDLTHDSLDLHFLQHAPCHLCYDVLAYTYGGQAPDREGTGWTLSRWWIKRSRCCASEVA